MITIDGGDDVHDDYESMAICTNNLHNTHTKLIVLIILLTSFMAAFVSGSIDWIDKLAPFRWPREYQQNAGAKSRKIFCRGEGVLFADKKCRVSLFCR